MTKAARKRRTRKRKEFEQRQPDPLTAFIDASDDALLRAHGVDPDDPDEEYWDECDQHDHWPDLSGPAACLR